MPTFTNSCTRTLLFASSSLHSNMTCSGVSVRLHLQSSVFEKPNLCSLLLKYPCPVMNCAVLWLILICFISILLLMFPKYLCVVRPFSGSSHFFCHKLIITVLTSFFISLNWLVSTGAGRGEKWKFPTPTSVFLLMQYSTFRS